MLCTALRAVTWGNGQNHKSSAGKRWSFQEWSDREETCCCLSWLLWDLHSCPAGVWGERNSLISEAPSHSSQGTRPPCTPTCVRYIHVHFCSELSWKYQREFLCQKCLNHKNHCSEKENSPPMGDKYSVKVFGNKIPIFLHLIQ